jgi:hypothetical protein
VDAVHAWLVHRREVTHASIRALAAEIGISKSAVEGFYKHRNDPARIWPKLRDGYMRNYRSSMAGYKTPPDVLLISAHNMLLEFPEAERPDALRDLVGHLKDLYRSRNYPLPEFIAMLESEAEGRQEPS